MARTLIGELLIRMRSEGTGEVDKLSAAMNRLQSQAKRMNGMAGANWGAGFQRNLDTLKLAPRQIAEIERSWVSLQQTLAGKKGGARSRATAEWKQTWTSAMAQYKAQMDANFRAVEARARGHKEAMGGIMKSLFVSMGFYTAAYGGGVLARNAVLAASERSQVDADLYLRGLSDGERGKINTAAGSLSGKYGVSETNAREVLGDASMNMKDVDTAIATGDAQMKAYKLLLNTYGAEMAIGLMRQFNKGMDNLNVDESGLYTQLLDNAMKASQVTGKEFNPGDLAQSIKYARSSGKYFSTDFLTKDLPFIAAQTGASDAGTQIRATWDGMAGGRATKAAKSRQRKLGLRDDKGLVHLDEFAANPIDWMNKYLVPALAKEGITSDMPEFGQALSEIASNRLNSDFISNAIKGYEQLKRLRERSQNGAKGLAGADEIDDMSLPASFASLKAAFSDLATALVPVQSVIIPALNSLSSGVKALADMAKDNPLLTALGMGSAGVGAAWGGKKIFDFVTGGFGLQASAVALDGSAAALTRAAVALGGASGASAVGDGPWGNKGGKGGVRGRLAGPLMLLEMMYNFNPSDYIKESPEQVASNIRTINSRSGIAEREQDRSLRGLLPPTPGVGGSREAVLGVDDSALDATKAKAAETGAALQIQGAVDMDTSSIDAAIAKANQLRAVLQAAQQAGAAIGSQAGANVAKEMRRNFADRNL